MNEYPRETTEFVVITVSVDLVPVTTGVQFSLVPVTDRAVKPRPDLWVDAQVVDGKTAWLLSPQQNAGRLQVWAKVTDNPEIPVLDVGQITIT